MTNKISKKAIATAYEQRIRRRLAACKVIDDNDWVWDFLLSTYQSPVSYLRYYRGITWKDYFPQWGGTMYITYGMEYKPNN